MLLGELGLPLPPGVQGHPLERVEHPIVAEIYPLPFQDRSGPYAVLLEPPFNLVRNNGGAQALYHLDEDPGESSNLVQRELTRAEAMRERLDTFLSGLPAPAAPGPDATIDEETRELLESLGYTN